MKLREVAQPQHQFLTDPAAIKHWLDNMEIQFYTIRPDGVVDTAGSVHLDQLFASVLPVKFGTVQGWFSCPKSSLVSLRGCPEIVDGDFDCSGCRKLLSLKGGPRRVGGTFSCFQTPITTFEGAPEYIGKSFHGHHTGVRSLSGIQNIIKHAKTFDCDTGTTRILGLLYIKGLVNVEVGPEEVDNIMNKYLQTGDILSAQDELLDAGFKEQASL